MVAGEDRYFAGMACLIRGRLYSSGPRGVPDTRPRGVPDTRPPDVPIARTQTAWGSEIVPAPPVPQLQPPAGPPSALPWDPGHDPASQPLATGTRWIPWAMLLRRVLHLDGLECKCGAQDADHRLQH